MSEPPLLSPESRARVIESCARTWATLWPGLRATPTAIEHAAAAPLEIDSAFTVRYAILRSGTGPDLLAEGQALVEEITVQALFGLEMARRRTWPGAGAASEPFPWIVRRSSTAENAALAGCDESDAVAGAYVDGDEARWAFGKGAHPRARRWCLHLAKKQCFDHSGSLPAHECPWLDRDALAEVERTRAERQDALAHQVFRMRANEERPRTGAKAHLHVRLTHGAVHRYLNPAGSAVCRFCRVIPANVGSAEEPRFVIDERQAVLPFGA